MSTIDGIHTLPERPNEKLALKCAGTDTIMAFDQRRQSLTRGFRRQATRATFEHVVHKGRSEAHHVKRVGDYLAVALQSRRVSPPDGTLRAALLFATLPPGCFSSRVVTHPAKTAFGLNSTPLDALPQRFTINALTSRLGSFNGLSQTRLPQRVVRVDDFKRRFLATNMAKCSFALGKGRTEPLRTVDTNGMRSG